MSLRIVTANRLSDGLVVYLTATGSWSERISEAVMAEDDAAADSLLVAGREAVVGRHVVDPYLISVLEAGDAIHPDQYREVIRASGPSVRADLGKQADFNEPASVD